MRSRSLRITYDHYRELILYIAFGLIALIAEVAIFANLLPLVGIFVANVCAMSVGIFIAFNLNFLFNFKSSNRYLDRAWRYTFVCLLGILLSTLLIYALIAFTGHLEAKIVTLPAIFLFQFSVNKLWTFAE